MVRARTLALLLGAAAGAVAVVRHGGTALGRRVPGGILIGDAGAYDRLSGFLLGSLYGSIAADVASVVPAGGRVLEVGCGPGHLSIRLADQHGFDVTGLDLDPVMIERARAKVAHGSPGDERRPAFVVGDAATLPFPDGSFDVVVSTLSMHHWPIRSQVSPRSVACCGQAVGRSCGTSGRVRCHSTQACPIRSNGPMALRWRS